MNDFYENIKKIKEKKIRIFQIIVTIIRGDAMSNNALLLDHTFKSAGINSRIYAINIEKELKKDVFIFKKLPKLNKNDIIIYHLCETTEINICIKKINCKKIVIYHNTTPGRYFKQYLPELCQHQYKSILDIQSLNKSFNWCIADSEFNKNDLVNLGYDEKKITVVPVYINFNDYKQLPDKNIIEKYKDGYTNILFVGRITPNKKHEDIIRAFAYYKKHVNDKSRLILIGSSIGEVYIEILKDYIKENELKDVIFTGKIPFLEILGFYCIADIFLCMSEHEGFCVPLVEAMIFDVPIIAYNSTAIPYTLNGSGILIDDKNPVLVSKIINCITNDNNIKQEIIEKQRERLKDFDELKIFKQILDIINHVMEE